MTIDRFVFGFAGGMILFSLIMYFAHSHYWLFLAAIVGANLLQASITGHCPLAKALKAIGFEPGKAFE